MKGDKLKDNFTLRDLDWGTKRLDNSFSSLVWQKYMHLYKFNNKPTLLVLCPKYCINWVEFMMTVDMAKVKLRKTTAYRMVKKHSLNVLYL